MDDGAWDACTVPGGDGCQFVVGGVDVLIRLGGGSHRRTDVGGVAAQARDGPFDKVVGKGVVGISHLRLPPSVDVGLEGDAEIFGTIRSVQRLEVVGNVTSLCRCPLNTASPPGDIRTLVENVLVAIRWSAAAARSEHQDQSTNQP